MDLAPRTTTHDLLRQYAAILDELNERRVVRSRSAPAGDLAETLVAAAYGGELAPPSQKSWDVRAADARRLQVKCRVVTSGRLRGNYSPFRSWEFDACVFVLLDASTYDVITAVEVPEDSIRTAAQDAPWVNGFRIPLRAPMLTVPGATDVSERLRKALAGLD